MEVSHELASHLDASVAEYQAADYSEEDARDAAIKDFGDPDAVADGLWEANRFRLSLRAWGWWAARLTLLPACVLTTWLWVVPGLFSGSGVFQPGPGTGIDAVGARSVEARTKAGMTEAQRLIFYGDETADNDIDRRRAVRDAWPDEVLYQLELIAAMLSDLPDRPELDSEIVAAKRQALRKELERGAAMDPDNGVYALIRASLILDAVPLADEGQDDAAVVSVLVRGGEDGAREDREVPRLGPDADPAVVAEGIRWLDAAAEKPYLTMHVSDRVRDRLAQLPPARSMREYVMRVGHEFGTLLPTLGRARAAVRVAGAEALRQAEAGDAAGAVALLERADGLASALAASSDTVISLLVAWSIRSEVAVARVAAHRAAGDDRRAEAARARSDALVRYWSDVWQAERDPAEEARIEQTSGLLMSTIYPALPGYDVDTTPFRKAEYAVLDRGVLALGLGVLIALSALMSLAGGWGAWRRRDPAGPGAENGVLLTVGPGGWAAVIGGAVVLPVLGFTLWSATPWSGRRYGLNHSWAALVWYVPAVFGVAVLLWRLAVAALRRRAREVGLAVPGRRGWVSDAGLALALLALALLALAGVVWASISWKERWADIDSFGWSVANTVAIVLAVLTATAWAVREVVWVRSVDRPWAALGRAAWVGLGVTGGLSALLAGLVYLSVDAVDRAPLSVVAVGVAAGLGLLSGWVWMMRQPGRTGWFARSVLRSMAPVWAAAGLALALGVGAGLNLRERALAGQMMAASPVWLDTEVERSNAKALRTYLAGDAVPAPRRR